MSDFLDKLGGALQGTAHIVKSVTKPLWALPVGLPMDIVTSPWNDDDEYNGFRNTLESRVLTRLGDLLEPLDLAVGHHGGEILHEVGSALHQIRSYGISRPLATATLAFDADVVGDDNWNPFSGNWRQAWNASRDISPGQAWTDAIFGQADGGSGATPQALLNKAGITGRVGEQGFDIEAEADRHLAFKHGFGKYTSGTMDFVAAWNLDPLVLTGKGVAVANRELRAKPIVLPEVSRPTFTARSGQEYGGGVAFKGRTLNVEEQMATNRVDNLVTTLLAQGAGKTGDEAVAARTYWLARNPTLTGRRAVDDGSALMHLLSQAGDEATARAVLRDGMNPSPLFHDQLRRHSEDLANQAARIRDNRVVPLERSLAEFGRPRSATEIGDRTRLQRRLAEANRQLATADDAARYAEFQARAAGSIRKVPRITGPQRLGDQFAERTGATWGVYQPSRYNVPLRVLKSATTMRAGVIDRNRGAEGYTQLRRLLERAGHGFDTKPLHRDDAARFGVATREGGLGEDVIGGHLSSWAAATTEEAQNAVILAAERDVVMHYAKRLGIADTDQGFRAAEAIIREAQIRRMEASRMPAQIERAYSGAPKTAGGAPGGPYLDHLDDGGVGYNTAILETQLANHFPLIDVDQLGKIMADHQATLLAEGDKVVDRLRGIRGTQAVEFGYAASDEILTKLNRVWKPAQLMRLGWPMRVVTDEQLRIMATIGALTHLPLLAHSLMHPNATTVAEIRAMKAELEELETLARESHALPESAVRDESGNLIPVYHGTNKGFSEFDDAAHGDQGWYGPGHYFTANPKYAGTYADPARGGNVRKHYLDIRNPWDWEAKTISEAEARTILAEARITDPAVIAKVRNPEFAPYTKSTDMTMERLGLAAITTKGDEIRFNRAIRKHMEAKGHDGITHRERIGGPVMTQKTKTARLLAFKGERSYVAFHAHQIHSPYIDKGGLSAAEAARVKELRKATKGRRKNRDARFSDDIELATGSGASVRAPGAFGGEEGAVFGDLSSSAGHQTRQDITQGAFAELAGLTGRYQNALRATAGRARTILPEAPGGATSVEIAAHEASYVTGWERAVNDQIGQSAIARRLLEGDAPESVALWLRKSKEGKELRKRIPTRGHDPNRWVSEIQQHIEHYLPTYELKELALSGRARVTHLEQALGKDRALWPEVHGESVASALGTSRIGQAWDRMVSGAYRRLGATPTNVLSRHPHFAASYQREMALMVGAHDGDHIGRAALEAMTRKARERALSDVRHTLYDLSNSSNLAHTFRYVAPFYNAWQEALTRWGGLFMEDPSRLARMVQMWESPSKAGLVRTDPDTGHQYIVINPPDWLLPEAAQGEFAIPKYWMRDLVAQGSYWMLPGTGVPVAVPLGQMVRHRPDNYEEVKALMPYGPGRDVLDQMLPATLKRVRSLWSKEDDPAYAQALFRIGQSVETERQIALSRGEKALSPEQAQAEAVRRTNEFFIVRAIGNLTLPFSPTMGTPYDGYAQIAKNFAKTYSAYPEGKDPNGKRWEEAYIDQVGEQFWAYTASASKSNAGVAPTNEGFRAGRKYADLIAAAPELGSLITGSAANRDADDFSSPVYQSQFRTPVAPGSQTKMRELLDPAAGLKEAQADLGWNEYMKISNLIDKAVVARGYKTLAGDAVRDLAVAKREYVERLAEKYPAWAEERNTMVLDKTQKVIGFLREHGRDDRFADRPGWNTLMGEYMPMRDKFTAVLDQRYRAGGDVSLTSPNNADLAGAWEALVGTWVEKNPAFAQIFHRWLERDLGRQPPEEAAA